MRSPELVPYQAPSASLTQPAEIQHTEGHDTGNKRVLIGAILKPKACDKRKVAGGAARAVIEGLLPLSFCDKNHAGMMEFARAVFEVGHPTRLVR